MRATAPKKKKAHEGWKTLVVNGLMLVAAVLPDVQEFLVKMEWGTQEVAEAIIFVNILLRIATKGPVGMRLAVMRQASRWLTGRKIK